MSQPERPLLGISWIETSEHRVKLSEQQFADLVEVDVAVIRAFVDARKAEELTKYDLENLLAGLDDDGFEGMTRESVEIVVQTPTQLVRKRKDGRDG